MAKSLVIVESPTKARTMSRYLGDAYDVESSKGHVRDLPQRKFGVDIDNGFAPEYIITESKERLIGSLKKKARSAPEVFLAPDPDREGEAIAWHLSEALNLPPEKVRRVTFDEFTKLAIMEAMSHPGEINMNLVNAQQARRILDRIVGYKVSPILWRKITRGLSAGRVQSVAVRLIVEREREIRAFEARPLSEREYWTICATLHKKGFPKETFEAELRTKDRIRTESEAAALVQDLKRRDFRVALVESKEKRPHAPPPFSTDLMLQQASIHLRFPTKRTGVIAQQLYEGIDIGEGGPTGLITYMRTDSYHVSAGALAQCRDFIRASFGASYLPDEPNFYQAGKGAQEAHEAIRPTDVTRTPESIRNSLDDDQFRLYELIWNRFVASQLSPALIRNTKVEVTAGDHVFVAKAQQTVFDGCLKLAPTREPDSFLPELVEGDPLQLVDLTPDQHFDQPPPRYSEATLVGALKKLGIGRPSTYSAIISTIQDRRYVSLLRRPYLVCSNSPDCKYNEPISDKSRQPARTHESRHTCPECGSLMTFQQKGTRVFHATPMGEVVTDSLVKHFPTVLDVQFTSNMEEELDRIAEGELNWQKVLATFYKDFSRNLKDAEKNMEKAVQESDHLCPKCNKPMIYRFSKDQGERFLACSGYPECKQTLPVDADGNIVERPAPQETEHKCPTCGNPLVRRSGRRGEFLACSGYPDCKTTFNMDQNGNPVLRPQPVQTDEVCPKCGKPMVIRSGKRGRFLSCSGYPKCKSTKNLEGEKEKAAPAPAPVETSEVCSKCGKPMVVRNGKRGQFLACSGYPKCKSTKNLEGGETRTAPAPKAAKTGAKCPEEGCDGELLERKGRFGIFYGCSNYPKCKFTAKTLPQE